MCGAPFDLKRSYTNLNVVDSFKKKNNKKTIITLIIEHMCCCEEGEIVLEEIFSTAILVPLIAVGGKNLANHRKLFFPPPNILFSTHRKQMVKEEARPLNLK